MDVPLTAAYGRLLDELSRRVGSSYAELLYHGEATGPVRPLASSGVLVTDNSPMRWLELPIREGALEVGRLRMAFKSGADLPGPRERAMAQALVELAALLLEARHRDDAQSLRQAGRRILAVNEEEMQRVILDLHDGPVQKLFVVSSHLALLQSQLADYPPEVQNDLATPLSRAVELLQLALQEIKTTLSTFRPAEFQRRSLESVLQSLAFQHEVLTGSQVDLMIAGDIPPVGLPVKIALYRVLQEALANSYRHAGVDAQEVFLNQEDGWIVLEVADHGVGFTPPPLDGPGATEREEHIGLRGMRERVQLVGGFLRVESSPGAGTRVIVQVPSEG